ncbi:unnamed protein product [Schistosoma turkestanicum]|nr:unnamed protein product [Schistosoma turkestanicum]
MSRDISPLFTSLVSSIRPTSSNLSSISDADETKKKKMDISDTTYEFSFHTRAESLHSSLKILSTYLKRIHQLTAGTLGNTMKQRLHAELTENVTVLIDQCTLLLAQLKDLIYTTKNDNSSKMDKTTKSISNDVGNSDCKNQLISHRLTIHKLLSDELDSLKKLRESEIKRQQRLVELSGNLATGVRSVVAAAAASASGTNITDYLKSSNKYENTDSKLKKRGTNHNQNDQTFHKLSTSQQQEESENFTENELRTLDAENQMLYRHLTQEKDELHQVAQKISEIGHLNQTLSEHLMEQLETTEKIADSSVTATEYIRQGNELLREAIDSKATIKRQQRLVELSGNLATGVRSVVAAAAASASGTNITDYLKSSNKYENTDSKLKKRGTNHNQNDQTFHKLSTSQQQEESENFTENELRTLDAENQMLYRHLTQEKDELHQVAQKISEIGHLNQTLSEHLMEQLETTEKIADSSVTATEYIRQGNELLREAIDSKATVQFWMLFILIILTFSLHFLDWFYP